ncbi:MAG: hypothetical protein GXP16_06925, partial [Gammaproteobacteria bacterium]|nr:hypothetical protein [Gammaproteobacteria bacterium]
MKIIITAGFDRSLAALALCESLQAMGHEIVTVIVTSPLNWQRIKHFYKQRGVDGLLHAFRKLLGHEVGTSKMGTLLLHLKSFTVKEQSLKAWCNQRVINHFFVRGLNSQQAVGILKSTDSDLIVYAGGGILREKFITAAKGNIINAHSGPLPQIRGMNAIEWALLLDEPLQATVHIIDQGIDSGAILGKFDIDIVSDETIASLREKAVVAGINGLVGLLNGVNQLNEIPSGKNLQPIGNRQCFVMAPA